LGYLMGIDVGTTSARALVIRASDGSATSEAASEYPMYTPKPAWAEQDPADWVRGVGKAVRGALKKGGISKKDIVAVGLTGQMHSSVFLDKDDKVIRPAILWCDGRTEAECDEITRRVGKKRLLEKTLNIALPGFTAPKILWLAGHEPAAARRLAKVMVPKDYIRYVMTDALATEVSDASGMLLLDVPKRRWSSEVLGALEIPEAMLPPVFESPEITGSVSAEGARIFGLVKGTPVAGGGGDQAAGAVGNGIVKEGDATISLGTSGVVFSPVSKPPSPTGTTMHSFCHAVPGMWHTMGVMLSAGGSMQWFRNLMRFGRNKKLDYDEINRLAAEAGAGSDGLIFLPYPGGERTPHNDPSARGAFVGISLSHDMTHFARAVMEGVAFGIKDCMALMEDAGTSFRNIYISGGGAKSELWCAVMAGVLEKKLMRLEVDQGPAMGAAVARTLRVRDEIRPPRKDYKRYREAYARFRRLYPMLAPHFHGHP